MRYALNLSTDNRVLSACKVLSNGKYDGMVMVDRLPDGDVSEYEYVDGTYVHNPLSVEKGVEVHHENDLAGRIKRAEAQIEILQEQLSHAMITIAKQQKEIDSLRQVS